MEPSASRVRVIPYGVHGRLTWGDLGVLTGPQDRERKRPRPRRVGRSHALCHSSALTQLLLRLERVLDLLADGLVVLVQQLLFLFGQDSERHAHQALLELHVEPMLAVRDAARHLEVEPAEARAFVAELDLVNRHHARVQVGEEGERARPARARRKVVDRVALDFLPVLQRAGVALPVLVDRRQGNRLAVGRFERQRLPLQLLVRRFVEHRHADLEEHPLLADRPVGELVSDDDVAFVVVRGPDELALHRHDLRHARLGDLHLGRLLGLNIASNSGGRHGHQAGDEQQQRGLRFHRSLSSEGAPSFHNHTPTIARCGPRIGDRRFVSSIG